MTLAELFHAVNLAGIRLANVGGRLQLRPAGAVTEAIRAAAAEHKAELLAIMPETAADADAAELAAERAAIQWADTLPRTATAALANAWDRLEPVLWDAAKAETLAAEALARHHAAGWPGNAESRRRRGELLDGIDATFLARDMIGLQMATGAFLAAVPAPAPVNPEDAHAVLRWVDELGELPSCLGCSFCALTSG